MEFLYEYGLFLLKAVTVVVALIVVITSIVSASQKNKQAKGELDIQNLSEGLEDMYENAQALLLDKQALKKREKEKKKKEKAEAKEKKKKEKTQLKGKSTEPSESSETASDDKREETRIFVLDFDGSVDANEVDLLREEVTAVIAIAEPGDEVLVRLESGGGVVHGYGLAASQLQRIKDSDIKLTVAVDQIAASGGYMMACVADRLIAAPFAIIGSIGVIAQLPNFNRLLKKNDIDFEMHTAGDFKRTLTVFGENNDEGREKFKAELEEVHVMFKDFVSGNRPQLDLDKVATGEYWYGQQALKLSLVDELQTSDDFLMQENKEKTIFSVQYNVKKTLAEKFGTAASTAIQSTLVKLLSRSTNFFK